MLIQPVILAAGKGTRMVSDIPKVLIPINGKPIIQHLIDALKPCQSITTPLIVVGDNETEIRKTLPCDLKYATQKKPRGTGHALQCALPHITSQYTLVCYGDHPFFQTHTFQKFCASATNKNTTTIGTVTVPHYQQWYATFEHWGRVIKKNNTVTSIIEFKDANAITRDITQVNASPYLFETAWLNQNIHKLSDQNAQSELYITDLIKIASQQHKTVHTIEIPPKQAIGINTKQQLEFAQNSVKTAQLNT